MSPRRFEDILRRLQNMSSRRVQDMYSRRLEEIFSGTILRLPRRIQDVFARRLQDQSIPAYDDRYIKTKLRTYGNKIYTNFRGLNVLKHDIECESFTVIFLLILSLYVAANITCKYI